ncbi:MAG: D-alanyl-D-alanine carboxypeptidase/D-alanyl-D-alanine-endopeptidase [Candidatus Kapabacteria bacterium]|nr:D-alanyl-D-alanine carboxypeptidase/D-alanyl-D-alanine-endopeptidase [Candidatus Kapabacteria bacterium]
MKRSAKRILVVVIAVVAASVCAVAQQPRVYKAPIASQFDSTQALGLLRARLDQIFTSAPYRSSRVSVHVWSVKRNMVIYDRNGRQNLTPASTTKIFSTAAYYHHFGRNAVISTDVRTDGTLDADGTLRGNLYLIGHGDALLSVNDLEDLADQVHALGVRRITGNIYGDATAFDGQTNRAVYSGDYEDVQPLAPITALTVNKGSVAIFASAGPSGRVNVQTIPSSDAFDVVIRAAAVKARKPSSPKSKKVPTKSKKKRHAGILLGESIERYGDAPPEPRHRRQGRDRTRAPRISVTSSTMPNGMQQFVVSGSPGANRSTTVYVAMSRPAFATAGVFANRLRGGGIYIGGGIGEKKAPQNARMLTQFHRPFVEFASVVNKRSDNFLAEHVFKMVGAACGDHTTTAARAKRAVVDVLDSMGVERNNCLFNDGSGLSRRNLVCAVTEAGLLRQISKEDWGPEFRSTLGIASRDGTIRGRMSGTPASNNVTAKTGTLRNVSALAGYVTTRDGELLVFSFISNGPYVGSFKGMENLAAIALASFSYRLPLPPPSDILPTPADTLDD